MRRGLELYNTCPVHVPLRRKETCAKGSSAPTGASQLHMPRVASLPSPCLVQDHLIREMQRS